MLDDLLLLLLVLFSVISIMKEISKKKKFSSCKKKMSSVRCKSSARRRDRMKEHYQPSSSINLISSGWKEREKEQKKIFHWFISVKDLRKRKNLHFFFSSSSFSFNESAFFFSLVTCQRAVWHTYIRETK